MRRFQVKLNFGYLVILLEVNSINWLESNGYSTTVLLKIVFSLTLSCIKESTRGCKMEMAPACYKRTKISNLYFVTNLNKIISHTSMYYIIPIEINQQGHDPEEDESLYDP